MIKRHLKITCLSLLLLNITILLKAAEYTYTANEAATISGKTFAAGDIITLQNGDWNNISLRIRGTGTQTEPIIVKAQTAGSVIFTGSSNLTLDGSYLEVSGVLFQGTSTVGKTHVITFSKNSSYCRLTDSAIRNYNPADEEKWPGTDNKWISLNGVHNRVDHCLFEGKGNIGTLLVVWLVKDQAANHQIDHNHFFKRVPLLDSSNKEINGQETIRIGDSSTSMTMASCIIEYNFFEECDGEIEIISNKSCGNIYRHNVFYNNNGSLTLRHGNDCEVYGNYFLGNNKSKAGGLRIIGENHKAYNNYFQDIKSSGYRSALCMVNGKQGSALNEYFQVKNAEVLFNTFYNCTNVFTIGFDGGKDLAPIACTIAHNVVFANSASQTGVNITNDKSEITWKNNLMYQGQFKNFSPTEQEFQRVTSNLNFQSTHSIYTIYQPTKESIISSSYKTNEYPEITIDLQGRPRPAERMIGAFELIGESTIPIPTPQTIGCSFINKNPDNILITIEEKDKLITNFTINNEQMTITSKEKTLNLRIYNL